MNKSGVGGRMVLNSAFRQAMRRYTAAQFYTAMILFSAEYRSNRVTEAALLKRLRTATRGSRVRRRTLCAPTLLESQVSGQNPC